MGGTHFLQTGYLLLNRNAPFSYFVPLTITKKDIPLKFLLEKCPYSTKYELELTRF